VEAYLSLQIFRQEFRAHCSYPAQLL
jgi:hypothetical protein